MRELPERHSSFKVYFSARSHTLCSCGVGWLVLSVKGEVTDTWPTSSSDVESRCFLPMGLFKSNFVMFLKPCRSQTSHGHIHSVQRISVRSGLSQYPFVNLVGKSSALECLFSGLGGKTHTEGHTNTRTTFPHIFQTFRRNWKPEDRSMRFPKMDDVSPSNWDVALAVILVNHRS